MSIWEIRWRFNSIRCYN